ncbi:hypothetical protein K474DRAFT_1281376 [Panus rudis PR-1116 ss-1]|nr:hypothetical protein K474DRAFT_1281376 [Panus rudis PR-1116 ss-1]
MSDLLFRLLSTTIDQLRPAHTDRLWLHSDQPPVAKRAFFEDIIRLPSFQPRWFRFPCHETVLDSCRRCYTLSQAPLLPFNLPNYGLAKMLLPPIESSFKVLHIRLVEEHAYLRVPTLPAGPRLHGMRISQELIPARRDPSPYTASELHTHMGPGFPAYGGALRQPSSNLT